MPINYDGQFELRYKYFVPFAGQPLLQHRHTIDVQLEAPPEPGTPFDEIVTVWHNATLSDLDTDTDTYGGYVRAMYTAACDFPVIELWQYPSEGYDATLISIKDYAATGSAGAGTLVMNSQLTISFTSILGGAMRVQLMEGVFGADAIVSYPFPAGPPSTLAAYLRDTTHPFVARDNQRPLASLKYSVTQNERLYNKRRNV